MTLRPIALLLISGLAAPAAPAEPPPAEEEAQAAPEAAPERVVLESDGWRLVGDWRLPPADAPIPAALLLHRAAGSRAEYTALATELARRGVASLALDLRAHGESTTLGRFQEPYGEHRHLLEQTHRDVNAALRWLRSQPAVDPDRIAAVGASYSGEAIGEALRASGEPARAYVLLSPGSFSEESIAGIDPSGASWLFVRTVEEGRVSREFVDAVFEGLDAGSRSAETLVLPGAGHATGIFEARPEVVEETAEWLERRLGSGGLPRATEGSG